MSNLQIIEDLCAICCKLAKMLYEVILESEHHKNFVDLDAISNEFRDLTNDELLDIEAREFIRQEID